MLKLFCAIVGAEGDAFSVDIDASKTVDDLKQAIKTKNPKTITCDAKDLQLVFAKKEQLQAKEDNGTNVEKDETTFGSAKKNEWLEDEADVALKLRTGQTPESVNKVLRGEQVLPTKLLSYWLFTMNKMELPSSDQIHVLVVLKRVLSGKRTRVDEWFVDNCFYAETKKRKVDEDEDGYDRTIKFFEMIDFPPLAHSMAKYAKIVEREAYVVIFEGLMLQVKRYLGEEVDANLVVTGNPGTGKSRFYLYCIFQLIFRCHAESSGLPSFDLVLNHKDRVQKYDDENEEFVELNGEQTRLLQDQPRVIRLIDGEATTLTGWKGVSVLFASPDVTGMRNYSKVNSHTFIIPAWTLEELQDYNSLLEDKLKVAENVLISRYNKFGGVPRYIFTDTERQNLNNLERAFKSFKPTEVISYVKSNLPVREANYSHLILQMVPRNRDLKDVFMLDFLSDYIAERVVAEVNESSLREMSAFAVAQANDGSGSTFAAQGKIYEMLCHRWFTLLKQQKLQFRPLGSTPPLPDLIIPKEMPMIRFSTLDDIKEPQDRVYYRPTPKPFGALDAFIVVNNTCYGLQMAINPNHGIKAAPLNTFLKWLGDVGIGQFYFVFVVPMGLAPRYQKQLVTTTADNVAQREGTSANVEQFVAEVNVFEDN